MSNFCEISVDNDSGKITVHQPMPIFVRAMDKARVMINEALSTGLDINDACLYMTFASVEENSFPFCGVSLKTPEMEGRLPLIRLNGSQTAMQYCLPCIAFDGLWNDLAIGAQESVGTDIDIMPRTLQLIFDAADKSVSFSLTPIA